MSRDTNKEIEDEFKKKFYIFFRDYSFEIKDGTGFTGSGRTLPLGEMMLEFLQEKLEIQRKRTLEEVEENLGNLYGQLYGVPKIKFDVEKWKLSKLKYKDNG